jgi:hypothetical protein
MMDHVSKFLVAIKNYGLNSTFSPEDLVHLRNPSAVINVVYELATLVLLNHNLSLQLFDTSFAFPRLNGMAFNRRWFRSQTRIWKR